MVILFICRSLCCRFFCRLCILEVVILFSWFFCCRCFLCRCFCFRFPGCSHQLCKSLLESLDLRFLICRRSYGHACMLRCILSHVSEEFVLIYRLVLIVILFLCIIIVASYRFSASLSGDVEVLIFCIGVKVSFENIVFFRSFLFVFFRNVF